MFTAWNVSWLEKELTDKVSREEKQNEIKR